jgi:hypothetical protein
VAQPAGVYQVAQSFDTLPFDFNGDGLTDFLYSPQNGGPRQLWQNKGDGTFTLATTMSWAVNTKDQHSCASADVDHNGLPDVYCALGAIHGTRTKSNSLFLQELPGTFTDVGASVGVDDPSGRSYSATFLDANHDGWPDLFVDDMHPRTDGLPTTDRLFLNLGADPVDGHWLGFQDDPGSGVELEQGDRGCDFTADFNHDGLDDIVFCGSTTMRWYRNNGDGTFTDVHIQLLGGPFFASDAKLTDVNGDGIADLVYAKVPQWGVRLGTASGTFAKARTWPLTAGRMVEVGDVDGNGTPDVYVLQGNGTPGCNKSCPTNYPDYLYSNDGHGNFTQVATINASGSGDTVDRIDVNNDGTFELIVGNGANLTPGPLQLLGWTPDTPPPAP